jgi:hypothetical protein
MGETLVVHKNGINHYYTNQKTEMEIFAFCTITFEPIEIWTCEAPQNDCLNFSFVKDTRMVGKKKTGNDRKTAIYESVLN